MSDPIELLLYTLGWCGVLVVPVGILIFLVGIVRALWRDEKFYRQHQQKLRQIMRGIE